MLIDVHVESSVIDDDVAILGAVMETAAVAEQQRLLEEKWSPRQKQSWSLER